MPKIEDDGVSHINVYSKGKTDLGKFNSIEGYWYWLSCADEKLRELDGFDAKLYGRAAGGEDWIEDDEFKMKIKQAICYKIIAHNVIDFIKSELTFKHYYVYNNKIVEPKEGKWITKYLEELRTELRKILMYE